LGREGDIIFGFFLFYSIKNRKSDIMTSRISGREEMLYESGGEGGII